VFGARRSRADASRAAERPAQSDSNGAAFPKDNPKPPHDVLATIYQHLGVDARKAVIELGLAGAGRPCCPRGEPLRELFV
jgi:hypothetical protein